MEYLIILFVAFTIITIIDHVALSLRVAKLEGIIQILLSDRPYVFETMRKVGIDLEQTHSCDDEGVDKNDL